MSASTYFPDIYDALNRGSEDADWYAAHAVRVGGPVLELGCGTGRTLLPVARAGIDIDGLDVSAEMLASLRAKLADEPQAVRDRVSIGEGDMADFVPSRQYGVVQIPFRTFLHNTSLQAQHACLQRCREALRPGGALVFNVFFPSLDYMAQSVGAGEGVWRLTATTASSAGHLTLFQEWTSYRPADQTLRSLHRFETYDERGQLRSTRLQQLDLAYLYPGDLKYLLTQAGFEQIRVVAAFDEKPLTHDDQEILVLAIRPPTG